MSELVPLVTGFVFGGFGMAIFIIVWLYWDSMPYEGELYLDDVIEDFRAMRALLAIRATGVQAREAMMLQARRRQGRA